MVENTLVPSAFDGFAGSYDADFSQRAPARRLREIVWKHLQPFVRPGMRVLDLGCGTGEDAMWLARSGCKVTAADTSLAMLDITRRKAERLKFGDRITTMLFDVNHPVGLQCRFDFILSNFGALNCATDLRTLAAELRAAMTPSGIVAVNVMGRFCVWETLWFGLRMNRSAVRRWRGRATADIAGKTITVRYWSPSEISNAFGAEYQVESVHGIGTFLPPSYLFSLVEARPCLFERLSRWEERATSHPLAVRTADHQLTILRRKGHEP